ncbi:MAG: mismatch-specific DNA-glycosylase [Nitrospirota bacterium]|nr:mismatch-specific DNA-glycosylase [Nitrospirota bacterium]
MSHPNSGLPDYLAPGLSILFVGINPGLRSAEVGHHFAGPSNRFWKLLFDARLIPSPMTYQDDWRLPEFGYGLTNLIARPTAGVHDLGKQDFLEGHQALLTKTTTYQPRLVALLGVSMARMLLSPEHSVSGEQRSPGNPIQVGLQSLPLAGAPVWVLPNPSGRNAHYSYQHMKALFCAVKDWAQQSCKDDGKEQSTTQQAVSLPEMMKD